MGSGASKSRIPEGGLGGFGQPVEWDADEPDAYAAGSAYDGKAELDKLLAKPPPGPQLDEDRLAYLMALFQPVPATPAEEEAGPAPQTLDEEEEEGGIPIKELAKKRWDAVNKQPTIALSRNRASASYVWSGSMHGGALFSRDPLKKTVHGRFYRFRIDDVDEKWHDDMGLGVSSDPQLALIHDWSHVPAYATRSWIFGYDGRGIAKRKTVMTRPANWKTVQVEGEWMPKHQRGDTYAVLVTFNGRIIIFYNGQIIMHYSVPDLGKERLWAAVDLDGRTTSITMLQDDGPDYDEVIQAARLGAMHS